MDNSGGRTSFFLAAAGRRTPCGSLLKGFGGIIGFMLNQSIKWSYQ
jgi:hypothetical protein